MAVRKPSPGAGRSATRRTDVARLLAAAVEALHGAHRPGQLAMAEAVEAAIGSGEHLLVQAGTGTGKSLGYLVPLVRHAVESGRPVVVSTATLALQHQVVERDLPRLAEALAPVLGRRPTMQTVKGRTNYLCLQKLAGGFPVDDTLFDLPALPGTVVASSASSRLGREVTRLREWADETGSGDRDELVPGVSERAWRQVSVTAHECLGAQQCSLAADCFVEKARERAGDVDVVVTNHALLAVDAFEGRQILPEHAVLVVDEAHELADRVTSAISAELTAAMVSAASKRAGTHGGVDADALQQAGDELAAVLEGLPEGRFASGLPQSLQTALGRVRDTARQVASALQQRPREQPVQAQGEGGLQLARAAVSDVLEVADRMSAELERDVIWFSRERVGPGEPRPTLHVAPLSVAALLRERLFKDRTIVLTSATLTLGGTFDAAARELGLSTSPSEEADDVPWRGLDVGSPFDYPRQAILYVARRLPPPGRDPISAAFLDELTALVQAAGGRTLGLFSSRRAAEAAAEAMRSRLDVEVLCQGDDAMPNLVRQFAAEPSTCLFGTLSLWQGVDVPGPSCQLVVIDRLPFPRPDDPLSSARQEAVAKAGGNGFMAVAAQHAALRLAQGAGRLVRSTGDRGVVAVLDSRLATARYGGYLRASLPPFWTTYDRDVALGALRRLSAVTGT
ncbi:MAG: ATP-dependent DNA helicase [Actinomycetes bacterium]